MFNYLNKNGDDLNYGKIVAHVAILIVLIVLFATSWGTVGASERGVKTRLNAVVGSVQPGPYFKVPFIEEVTNLDVSVQTINYDRNGAEGDAADTSSLSASSKDLQQVWANVMVNYKVDPASVESIYTEYKTTRNFGANVVESIVREAVKSVTAQYTAEELTTRRLEVSDRIKALLAEKFAERQVQLVQVNVTNFDYSPAFTAAIDQKVTAVQLAEAQKNKLEQVKYEAQQTIETAKATAEAQRIQAQSLAAQGGEDYVMLKAIEKWDGRYPGTYMGPQSSIPLIQVTK